MTTREQVWRKVYFTARDVYGSIPGYGDHDARLTADAAATGYFARDGLFGHRRRRLGGVARMPKPGNLLELGTFLELEYAMPTGEIRGFKFAYADRVPLLWSHSKQALFVLPFVPKSACDLPPRRTENQLAQIWAKGRPAACSGKIRIEPRPLPVQYPAIQVSYHSDKFSHGQSKPFIHHFGGGVYCYFSHDPSASSRAPDVMIRGGRLRLTTHGIDG